MKGILPGPAVGSLRMTQITGKQHFVPRFYLKRFAKEGQIQVFDVRAKRIGKPRPYGSVCYARSSSTPPRPAFRMKAVKYSKLMCSAGSRM